MNKVLRTTEAFLCCGAESPAKETIRCKCRPSEASRRAKTFFGRTDAIPRRFTQNDSGRSVLTTRLNRRAKTALLGRAKGARHLTHRYTSKGEVI